MPLTPEQARQIDWATLIARLLELRSPLVFAFNFLADGKVPLSDEVLNAYADCLSTIDAIGELVKGPVKGEDDAATS